MRYLIMEWWAGLAIAFIIGVVIGFLMRGSGRRHQPPPPRTAPKPPAS